MNTSTRTPFLSFIAIVVMAMAASVVCTSGSALDVADMVSALPQALPLAQTV